MVLRFAPVREMRRFSLAAPAPARSASPRRHLSLPETMVILLVFSVCLTASAVVISNQSLRWRWWLTETRMQHVDHLLKMHLAAFGRLPCPSDISRRSDDAMNGIEAGNHGVCTGAQPSANAADNQRVMGGIPFATLGLNEEEARDGWGNRMVYLLSGSWTGLDATPGATFQLRNLEDEVLDDQLAVVLWSAGVDGHGAYPGPGGLVRRHAAIASPWQMENCDCDAQGRSLGVNALFYQRAGLPEGSADAAQLDDVVRGISTDTLNHARAGGNRP